MRRPCITGSPVAHGSILRLRHGTQGFDVDPGLQMNIENGYITLVLPLFPPLAFRIINYDSPSLLRIVRGLIAHGASAAHATCVIRHQMCPKVIFLYSSAGKATFLLANGVSGG